MDERMSQQLAFALELDKEKNVLRQTHLSGHGRRENDRTEDGFKFHGKLLKVVGK